MTYISFIIMLAPWSGDGIQEGKFLSVMFYHIYVFKRSGNQVNGILKLRIFRVRRSV